NQLSLAKKIDKRNHKSFNQLFVIPTYITTKRTLEIHVLYECGTRSHSSVRLDAQSDTSHAFHKCSPRCSPRAGATHITIAFSDAHFGKKPLVFNYLYTYSLALIHLSERSPQTRASQPK
ncbi:hypothetical protein HAX54_042923, partial [Datura stramonium]|nr:hypothetical protein [Datura stramonium]